MCESGPDERLSRPELAGHPDRLRWNARYGGDFTPSFRPHPLAVEALRLLPPDGAVLELAAGPSGSALLAAAGGRPVTVVDVSDVALGLLAVEAAAREVAGQIRLVQTDLAEWDAGGSRYALVLCTNFWERGVFDSAVGAVAADGVLAWESLTEAVRQRRPEVPAAWCVQPGEPASLLPEDFDVIDQHDVPGQPGRPAERRQLLARRRASQGVDFEG